MVSLYVRFNLLVVNSNQPWLSSNHHYAPPASPAKCIEDDDEDDEDDDDDDDRDKDNDDDDASHA